ncbi:hypothetical protein AAFF_G00043960 [Aldrovandia affinis]|uniref:Protein LYRIC n=1 Tax=Aldrovandia affinis TaxID=143900 RepID=A0AAD7S2B8_9TELE|nr:hypothetical protein AAFF_G00043960 [Aldrovandia affinis]
MASSWQDLATQQAELLSSRLRELLSIGLGLLRSELGVDLGLEPDLYPTWMILATAFLGLLVIAVLWAAACGGRVGGRKRSVRTTEEEINDENTKASVSKAVKPDEQKKKNRKKPGEKKPQPNGRTVLDLEEEDAKVTEENLKPLSAEAKTEKVKKNKKKPKAEVKPTKNVSSDGKEHDEGNWETKISNRERRQQRRKDKLTGDESESPEGGNPPACAPLEPPKPTGAAPAGQRKSKEALRTKAGKGDAVISQVSASWSEAPAQNGAGWTDMAMKLPAQMAGSSDAESWSAAPVVAGHRSANPPTWGQEMEGSWSGADGRVKTDLSPVSSFTPRGLNPTAGEQQPISDMQWDSPPQVDDEWSGLNGVPADPGSDWNAPSVLWGNYEEPQPDPPTPPERPAAEAKERPRGCVWVLRGLRTRGKPAGEEEEEEKEEEAGRGDGRCAPGVGGAREGGFGCGEESSPPVQEKAPSAQAGAPTAEARAERPAGAAESTSQKPPTQVPQRPAEPESTAKQNSTPASSQKKSEENWESPKRVKKKKARRET